MKTILLIHGPNLNLLGKRDPTHYGSLTLKQLEGEVVKHARIHGFSVKCFQSNHEGALIDFLQKNSVRACGILINPGALTHYSFSLHDALVDTGLPCVEVHLSAVNSREKWRRLSVTAPACIGVKSGKKLQSYFEALAFLLTHL